MSDELLYPRPGTPDAVHARYQVYPDRVTISGSFCGTWVVPLAEVRGVVVRGPLWGGLAGLMWRPWWRHLKIGGWSDFRRHVELERAAGWFRWLHFVPSDPDGFVAAVAAARAARPQNEADAAGDRGT